MIATAKETIALHLAPADTWTASHRLRWVLWGLLASYTKAGIMNLDTAPGQGLPEFPHLRSAYLLAPPQIEVSQLSEIAQGRDVADLFKSTEI